MVMCLLCACPLHSLLRHTNYDREAIIWREEVEICEVEWLGDLVFGTKCLKVLIWILKSTILSLQPVLLSSSAEAVSREHIWRVCLPVLAGPVGRHEAPKLLKAGHKGCIPRDWESESTSKNRM